MRLSDYLPGLGVVLRIGAWRRERRIAREEALEIARRMLAEAPARAAWYQAREEMRRCDEEGRKREGDRWNRVMRWIEKLGGYSHQPDTATRYLED